MDLVFPHRGRRRAESLLVYSGSRSASSGRGGFARWPTSGSSIRLSGSARRRAPIRARPRAAIRDRGAGGEAPRSGISATRSSATTRATSTGPRRRGRESSSSRSARPRKGGTRWSASTSGARPGAGPDFEKAFEAAISEAAGLALQLLARGSRVGLVLGGQLLPPGSGPAHRRALLTAFALVEPSKDPAPAAVVPPPSISVFSVAVRSGGRAA